MTSTASPVIAADTSVVVRLLAHDSPAQSARAAELFRPEDVFLSRGVLLETARVLRRACRLDAKAVTRALRALAGQPIVEVEDARAVAAADRGIDFADALHVASGAGASKFVTFDRRLARQQALLDDSQVEAP